MTPVTNPARGLRVASAKNSKSGLSRDMRGYVRLSVAGKPCQNLLQFRLGATLLLDFGDVVRGTDA